MAVLGLLRVSVRALCSLSATGRSSAPSSIGKGEQFLLPGNGFALGVLLVALSEEVNPLFLRILSPFGQEKLPSVWGKNKDLVPF